MIINHRSKKVDLYEQRDGVDCRNFTFYAGSVAEDTRCSEFPLITLYLQLICLSGASLLWNRASWPSAISPGRPCVKSGLSGTYAIWSSYRVKMGAKGSRHRFRSKEDWPLHGQILRGFLSKNESRISSTAIAAIDQRIHIAFVGLAIPPLRSMASMGSDTGDHVRREATCGTFRGVAVKKKLHLFSLSHTLDNFSKSSNSAIGQPKPPRMYLIFRQSCRSRERGCFANLVQ